MADKKQYQAYIQSKKWKSKRRERLLRDSGQCVLCSSRYKLEVHHKTYIRFGNERMSDLVTLCEACHKQTHDQARKRIISAHGRNVRV